ncbi:TPA: hypothetical protein ACKP7M_000121 [Stenotrophomonas maltophilia]|uniref:hypothetical protein n=1 Tax=Stenotrophomonas TaxID=40323 RepID=UPI001F38A7A8|nr:hypothetical protein [Stenotrophomonas maltophilia]MDZ5831038.1 hypothetical protein [Stenotrophomonas maltophilia]
MNEGLAEYTGVFVGNPTPSTRIQAALHDLRAHVDDHSFGRLAQLEHNPARFVAGPVARLDLRSVRIQFNPDTMQPLPEHGTVCPRMRLTDTWGSLDVTDGALLQSDWKVVFVQAPASAEPPLEGPGWSLSLKPGWSLVPGTRMGDYVLKTNP